jgi:predicted metal-dependent hydrolase
MSYHTALAAGLGPELSNKYAEYVAKRDRKIRTGRVAKKDASKTRVYNAEWKFEKKFPGKTLADVNEARKFAEKVVKSKTWTKITDSRIVPVIEMKKDMGNHSATAGVAYGYGLIKLCPRHGLDTYVILHELAHSAGYMHHDLPFRKALLTLVSRFMGREAAKYLKECFKEQGLKMIVKKTKLMSPLEWLEKYNKMEAMRANLPV